MSIAYARTLPEPQLLRGLAARRADIDPLALIPVGKQGLRSFVHEYIEAGLSKFVIRPSASVESWADEAEWLADAILDLQT
jgi:hypothetical protein